MLDQSIEVVQRFIVAGFKVAPDVPAVAREVIPSAMYSMLNEHTRTRGPAPHARADPAPHLPGARPVPGAGAGVRRCERRHAEPPPRRTLSLSRPGDAQAAEPSPENL